jgi:hypothetical protein
VLYLLIVAIGTPVLLCTALLLDWHAGRRAAARHRSTLHVALELGRHDEGLRLLAEHSRRPDPWWTMTPGEDLQQIDDALNGWGVVAGYIADHQVDRGVVLDVFGWRIIETWEQAFTYIEDRRPELWEPLLELYVDAWQAAHPEEDSAGTAPEEGIGLLTGEPHAITPEDIPEVDVVPAEVLAPLLAAPRPTAPAPRSRVAEIKAALRTDAAEADAPTELVIDLVGPVDRAPPAPRAVHR